MSLSRPIHFHPPSRMTPAMKTAFLADSDQLVAFRPHSPHCTSSESRKPKTPPFFSLPVRNLPSASLSSSSSSTSGPSFVAAHASAVPALTEEDNASKSLPHLEKPNGAASNAASSSLLTPPSPSSTLREANGTAVLDQSAESTSADPTLGLGITQFLKGKNVLITGSTGFLAKVLVEKILREQPRVGGLYLVIQPRADASAEQRLASQVNGSQIFDRLRETHGPEYLEFMGDRLVAVEGNLCKEGLGMEGETAREVRGKVDVIINSAATTTFDERYDFALNLNTLGPKRMMEFAKSCPNLKMLVHVSTAFVNGLREGWTAERPFQEGDTIASELRGPGAPPGDLEPLVVERELELAQEELQKAQAKAEKEAQGGRRGYTSGGEEAVAAAVQRHMVDLGMRRAQHFGWQDTYVFTKALGEMMVSRALRDCPFPVAIVRPSIVESSAAEPMRGWMEGLRMADPILLAYGKGQMSGFLADPKGVLDMVPADFVINALLAAMAAGVQRAPGTLEVYHVATSVANPLCIQLVADATSDHFEREPMLVPREGAAIKVARMKVFQQPILFFVDVWLKYQLPLQLAKLFPGPKGSLSEKRTNLMLKTAQQLSYLAKIYEPYTFYACRFDASNTRSLLPCMSEEERERYPFDLTALDWHHYLCHTHLPGLRKYVLKGRGSKDTLL